jgi:peptidoglycan/LPS O-acetylase OafA/YrhL
MQPPDSKVDPVDVREKKWAAEILHREYRPHVDGLRCLAVIPVVLFHLASAICPGGFVGVDIFFVISGYLICGGILRDLQEGTFSLVTFYQRRIRRIFPAYFILVTSTLLAGIVLYPWSRLVPLAQTAFFSALFSTNIYFWVDIGYFQPNANGNPLLHLWTLGVEEQFYIIIPVVTTLLWRFMAASVKPILFLGLFLSLILCGVLGEKGQSTTAFYILPTRAWELLAGAMISNLPRSKTSLLSVLLSLLGLALILLTFWSLSTAKTFEGGGTRTEVILPLIGSLGMFPFPGWTAIPVVVGSLLLLQYGDTGPVSRLLSASPLTAVGKISYSLYLWHWPLVVYARYISYDRDNSLMMAIVFVLAFVAAYLSWRWVEMPVRRSKAFTPRLAFGLLGWGCAFLWIVCFLLISTEGLRQFIHLKANQYASAPRPFLPDLEKFVADPPFHPPPYPLIDKHYVEALGDPEQKPSFCIMGDSHAKALAPGLSRVAAEYHRSGFYLMKKMAPFVGVSNGIEQRMIEWVAANPDIHDVYLVGRWLKQFEVPDALPELGDKGTIKPFTLDPKIAGEFDRRFRRTAEFFAQHGKRVFVFNCVPEYNYAPNDIMARSQIIPLSLPIEITREDYLAREAPITQILALIKKEGLITVIPLESGLISGDETVFMGPMGEAYYKDDNHLTPTGAYRASEAVAPLLWPGNPPAL